MGNFRSLCAATLIICLLTGSLHASPWPRALGGKFDRTEVEAFQSQAGSDRFVQFSTRNYMERGVGDRLTLGANIGGAYQEAVGTNYHDQAAGLTDAEGFAIVHTGQFARTAHAWRLSGGLKTTKIADGSREMGQDAYLGLSRMIGFGSERVFAVGELGGRFSLGDDADQLRFDATLGLKHRRWMLLGSQFSTYSVNDRQRNGVAFDLVTLSFSLVGPVRERMRFEVGHRFDTYTDNITGGSSFFAALWWNL